MVRLKGSCLSVGLSVLGYSIFQKERFAEYDTVLELVVTGKQELPEVGANAHSCTVLPCTNEVMCTCTALIICPENFF